MSVRNWHLDDQVGRGKKGRSKSLYIIRIRVAFQKLRTEIDQGSQVEFLIQFQSIFGEQVKAVIIFTAAKTGGVEVTEIDIKGIVPAVFCFFLEVV